MKDQRLVWRCRRPSTTWRNCASACGDGSLALTRNPRARKNAVQLAPIVPVPITATWRTSRCCILDLSSRLGRAAASTGMARLC